MTVRETASLHPATVTEVSQGKHKPRRRRPASRPQDRWGRTVHPDAWAIAMKAADGDVRRIQVHHARSVTIHNTADWR